MSAVITHTLYTHYTRQQKQAIVQLVNHRSELFIDSVGLSKEDIRQQILQHPNDYLVMADAEFTPIQERIDHSIAHVDFLENHSTLPSAEKQHQIQQTNDKIEAERKKLADYMTAYETAVSDYRVADNQLNALLLTGDMFLAPEGKRDEYLHIIDEETCRHLCEREEQEQDCFRTFSDKQIELSGHQTDAVRVWRNNVTVSHLNISDPRIDTETAHRDGIQLLPPPLYEEQATPQGMTRIKIADQSAGTILENVEIRDCVINAPQAALQGIFSSDGMCRDVTIDHVEITTKGGHFITLSGVLTGCEIRNVTLHQVPDGPSPKIVLDPLRVGGNMADEGMAYILGLDGTNGFEYGEVVNTNNRATLQGQSDEDVEIEDRRSAIPSIYWPLAFGLRQFNFQQYLNEYSQWTVDMFKQRMPDKFEQMKAWIDVRVREYSSGQRDQGSALFPPSTEQMSTANGSLLNRLIDAQQALQVYANEFKNTRLPELQETPIRTFAIKSIALRNGELIPLMDLGMADNERRKDHLRFLLDDVHFNNLVPNVNGGTDTPPPAFVIPSQVIPADSDVLPDLRISAETVNQGEVVSIFLQEASRFNDGYRHFWRIAGVDSSVIPFSQTHQYDIDTSRLSVGRQRIQMALHRHNPQETIGVNIFFNVVV
jgi:hypothetical protein